MPSPAVCKTAELLIGTSGITICKTKNNTYFTEVLWAAPDPQRVWFVAYIINKYPGALATFSGLHTAETELAAPQCTTPLLLFL